MTPKRGNSKILEGRLVCAYYHRIRDNTCKSFLHRTRAIVLFSVVGSSQISKSISVAKSCRKIGTAGKESRSRKRVCVKISFQILRKIFSVSIPGYLACSIFIQRMVQLSDRRNFWKSGIWTWWDESLCQICYLFLILLVYATAVRTSANG